MKKRINVALVSQVPAMIGNICKVVFVIIGTIIGAGFASRSRNMFVF